MKFCRKFLLAVLGLTALIVVCYFATVLLLQTPQFRLWLQAEIQERTGYRVQIEKIAVEMPFFVVGSSVEAILGQSGRFTSKRIRLDLNPVSLFFRRLRSIRLVQPVLHARLDSAGESRQGTALALTVGSLQIEDGELFVENAKGHLFQLPAVNLEASNLDLGGHTGTLITTAEVPWLQGALEVKASAKAAGITAKLSLLQDMPDPESPARAKRSSSGLATADIEVSFQDNGTATLSTRGQLERFKLSSGAISGDFVSRLSTGKTLDTIQLSLKSNLTRLPISVQGVELVPLSEPATIVAEGHYVMDPATLSLKNIEVKSPYVSMSGKTEVRFEDTPSLAGVVVQIEEVRLEKLGAPLAQAGYPLAGLEGKATGRISASGRLAPLQLSGVLQSEFVNAGARGIRFSKATAAVPFSYGSSTVEVRDGRFTGRDGVWKDSSQGTEIGLPKVELRVNLAHKTLSGDLQFANGRFSAKKGLRAGEHISGEGRFSVRTDARSGIQVDLGMELSSLELLWDRFFGDFKGKKPSLQLAGRYDTSRDELDLARSEISLGNVGKLALKGTVRGLNHDKPALDLALDSRSIRVVGLYDLFIRETFNASYPLLSKLETSGTATVAVELQGNADAFSASGSLELRRLEIQEASRWRVGPVDLMLPLRIQYPTTASPSGPRSAPEARLTVGEIEYGATRIPRFNAIFTLWDNTLQLLRPVKISLYKGALIVNEAAWDNIVLSPLDFSFSAELRDLELRPLTEDMGWYPFEGTLSGVVPKVTRVGDTLRTNGELNLSVFGGRVKITDLQVTKPTGSLPSLQVNVRLESLDLERATKAFEFGRISGILEGAIDGLVITHGQPAAFEARVQTVSTGGVSQWISVEALNKISVLSSGTESGLLYGTLARLFDFYRYRKLGFTAKLENDLMILRGIVTKDGQDYLVEGTLLPPTVNIVSHTQRIGFSELVRRLERVQQVGKPTTQKPEKASKEE